MTASMPTLAFVDTETTGTDWLTHEVWEVAAIIRKPGLPDTEHLWQLAPIDLATAETEALEVGRFHERYCVPPGWEAAATAGLPFGYLKHATRTQVTDTLRTLLQDAILIGSNAHFDACFLRVLLGAAPWHYRPVDIAAFAAGHQRCLGAHARVPFDSRGLSQAVGVIPPDKDASHTALGDARWHRDVYDAVMRGAIVHAAPEPGSARTSCCGRNVADLPRTAEFTLSPESVTCPGGHGNTRKET